MTVVYLTFLKRDSGTTPESFTHSSRVRIIKTLFKYLLSGWTEQVFCEEVRSYLPV